MASFLLTLNIASSNPINHGLYIFLLVCYIGLDLGISLYRFTMKAFRQALLSCKKSSTTTRGFASGNKVTGEGSVAYSHGTTPKVSKSMASTATSVAAKEQSLDTSRSSKSIRTPLDVPLPGLAQIEYSEAEKITYNTELTTLENGMRIGSQPRSGKFCTIGVAIKSGARFEKGLPLGVSHLAEKLGFLSTQKYPSREHVMKQLETHSAICDSQTSRDITVYALSADSRGIRPMMELLGDAVFNPLLSEEEIQQAKTSVMYEMEDMQMRPEQEGLIMEMIHAAAWSNNTLGNPRFCPAETAGSISRNDILRFMKRNFTPDRIVVSGVGVEHKELVDLTKEFLDVSKSTWNKEGVSLDGISLTDEPAKYSGGEIRVDKDFGPFNAGPLPVPKLAHMALGLESVPHSDRLFIPACVMNIMMGGGGSFSAGGPGKGMYSRLYTNVLNMKHWVYNATAYNNSYGDSGLFSIYASAPPEYMHHMMDILIQEFHGLAENFDQEEFDVSCCYIVS